MSTFAEQQRLSVTFRLWTVLADPAVRMAIAASGLAAAVAGGLLLATSDHLVDPVAFGLQVAVMVVGAVQRRRSVWLVRRPVSNRLGLVAARGRGLHGRDRRLQGATQPNCCAASVCCSRSAVVFFSCSTPSCSRSPTGTHRRVASDAADARRDTRSTRLESVRPVAPLLAGRQWQSCRWPAATLRVPRTAS